MEGFDIKDHYQWTTEELLVQAEGNQQAILFSTVKFLRDRGIPVEDWTKALGAGFIPSWGDATVWEPETFLNAALYNFLSMGVPVLRLEKNSERAEAVVGPFPIPAYVDYLGLPSDTGDEFFGVMHELAERVSLQWSHSREGENIRVTVTRSAT